MISHTKNPVEWALLVMEIDEFAEHTKDLSEQMANDGKIDIEDYQIQVGHLYAHINRIWNARNHIGEITDELFEFHSKFPNDIAPVG